MLSLYIIYEWMVTLLGKVFLQWRQFLGGLVDLIFMVGISDNIRNLTGHTASPDDIKQLTYMAYRFSPLIEELDTVRQTPFFFIYLIHNSKTHPTIVPISLSFHL